jgi:glycosyltransferase involved in cell wall biosynthesis
MTGWKSDFQQLAQKLGVFERIFWPGMLSGDAKWGAFRAAEFFVLPSHQENFGIVVAEAMALSKPVLISNKLNIWR